MKKQKSNTISVSIRIICLIFVLTTGACQTKTTTDKKTKEQAAAPKVDIHTAVVTNNAEALKQHIAAGTNINEKDQFGGSSPLITAALFGNTEMAKILLDAGADINFQNNDGSTALHVSSFFCRTEIVKLLLAKGADKTVRNKYGSTAYDSVAGPYSDVKSVYEMMGKMLEPAGLKLDYVYIEKTRPSVALLLK